jgi:hypothetical protein
MNNELGKPEPTLSKAKVKSIVEDYEPDAEYNQEHVLYANILKLYDSHEQLREALERITKHGRELGVGWCIQMAGVVLGGSRTEGF